MIYYNHPVSINKLFETEQCMRVIYSDILKLKGKISDITKNNNTYHATIEGAQFKTYFEFNNRGMLFGDAGAVSGVGKSDTPPYIELEQLFTTRFTPAFLAASNTLSVPCMLAKLASSGLSIENETLGNAAK